MIYTTSCLSLMAFIERMHVTCEHWKKVLHRDDDGGRCPLPLISISHDIGVHTLQELQQRVRRAGCQELRRARVNLLARRRLQVRVRRGK